MNAPLPPPAPLHLPAGLHYACVQCGRSCSESWEIRITPEEARDLRARDPHALTAAGAADPVDPAIASPWTPGGLMMRRAREGGPCCLLGADGLCSLHKAFGYDSKPDICRSFPWRFVETPRGAFAGLSFACTAVLADSGPAVEDQRAELDALRPNTRARRRIEAPPDLAFGLPLSWDHYFAIEEDLAALLDPALGPLPDRLLLQYLYLHLLIRLLRESRNAPGALAAGPEINDEPLAVFRRRARGDAAAPWAMLRAMTGRQPRSFAMRRIMLGFAHELRNLSGETVGPLRGYGRMVRAYLSHWAGRGELALPDLPAVPYRRLARVEFDPAAPEFDALLTRYFTHRLFRKDLLLADTVQLALQLMLMHYGLIQWYGAALAAARDAAAVERTDLDEAIRLIERYYARHTEQERLFRRMPLLRSILDRMFEHPLYAFLMTRGEGIPEKK